MMRARRVMPVVVGLLLVAACADEPDQPTVTTGTTGTTVTTAAPGTTAPPTAATVPPSSAPPATAAPVGPAAPPDPADLPDAELMAPDPDVAVGSQTAPAMGGVGFDVDDDVAVLTIHDTILAVPRGTDEPSGLGPEAVIGMTLQTVDGAPPATTTDVLGGIATVRDATIASTGDPIEALGHHLAGSGIEQPPASEDPYLCRVGRPGATAPVGVSTRCSRTPAAELASSIWFASPS